MADTNNTIKTTVVFDTAKAQTDLVKLNSTASDTTKELEERIEAKNKAVEISNALAKKTIDALNNERRTLEGKGATEKELMAIKVKLDKANVAAIKTSESYQKTLNSLNAKQEKAKVVIQEKADAEKKASSITGQLDEATGGLSTRFKALIANPVVAVMAAIVAIFTTLKAAVARSGEATETFNKIGAKLSGIMNGLLAVLEPVVIFLGEKLLKALEDPKQTIIDLGDSLKENIINRFEAVLVAGEAMALLFQGKFKEAAKKGADALIQLSTGVENGTDKMVELGEKTAEFAEQAQKDFDKAAKATENLANAELALVRNQIALEKSQLKSQDLAELQRQIRDDESKSIQERIEANNELGKILDEQLNREMAVAEQSLAIERMKLSATGQTIENIQAVGAAEVKLLEIQERINGQRSEQLVNENSLLKEKAELVQAEKDKKIEEEELAKEEAEKKKEAEALELEQKIERQIAYDEIELERKAMNGEATYELEKQILERKAELEISQARDNADKIALIEAQKKLALDKLKNAEEKATKDKNKAELDSNIEGAAEAFGVSQEVAVAKMLMAAPEAIGNVWSQAAKQPTIPQMLLHGAVGTVTTTAPIIKGLNDIKNTRFSKSKKGSSSGSASINANSGASASTSITPELVTDLSANSSANLGIDTGIGSSASADASNNVLGGASSNIVFSEGKYADFQRQVTFKEDKTTL